MLFWSSIRGLIVRKFINEGHINALHKVCYASPVVAITMFVAPLNIIQGIYAKHYGLALTTLAMIMLISRVIDTFTDPLIGYFVDSYQTRKGTRKPFIAIGALLALVSGYFIYVPPVMVTPIYAAIWFVVMFTAFSLFEIPHQTWPSDIDTGDAKNTTLGFYSYRVFAIYCGLIIFYSVPFLPIFDSQKITLDTLRYTFYIASVAVIPALILNVLLVPSGKSSVSIPTGKSMFSWRLIKDTLRMIAINKPFLLFLLAFIFSGFSVGMWYGVIFIYVDSYLGMGDQFAKMFLIAFLAGLLVTPVCHRLILLIGKKYTWALGIVLSVISYVYTGFLHPDATTHLQLMLLKVIHTCGVVCITVVTPAMLSEIADYSQLRFKHENNGLYFSIKIFVEKLNLAGGIALALAISGWLGYDVSSDYHSDSSLLGLKLASSWLPAIGGSIALVIIMFSPINERRHQIIKRRLDAIKSRRPACA